jgi:hypothetical protein
MWRIRGSCNYKSCSKLDFLPPRIFSILYLFLIARKTIFRFIFESRKNYHAGPTCQWRCSHTSCYYWLTWAVSSCHRAHAFKARSRPPMSEAPLLCAKSAVAPGPKRVVRTLPPSPPGRVPPHRALPCRAGRHLTPSVSSRRSPPPSPSVRAPPRRALPCCVGRHLTPYVSSRRSRRVPLFVIAASGPSPQLVPLA